MQPSNKSEEKDQQNTPQGVDNSEGIRITPEQFWAFNNAVLEDVSIQEKIKSHDMAKWAEADKQIDDLRKKFGITPTFY